MKQALVFVLFLLAGCTTSSEQVPGPSGAVIQQTKCNGSPSACFKQAAKTCGGSYQVVDSSSNAGGLVADILPGPIVWYKMSYQCGPSDGKLPTFEFRGPVYNPPVRTTTTCSKFGSTVTCNSF
jgi:hypothetical protein